MAAVVQTTLKNNIYSAYLSAQLLPSRSWQIDELEKALATITFAERELALTPVAMSGTQTARTEAQIITILEAAASSLATLIADADYGDGEAYLRGSIISVAEVIEGYRLFT